MIVVALLFALTGPAPKCQYIAAERIFARDLAPSVPEFAKLPPDVPLGYAPTPGQQKIFSAAELRRMAKNSGLEIAGSPDDLCFEWKMRPVMKDEMLAAMRRALHPRQVEIEIVEMSRFPAPEGEIVFNDPPVSGAASTAPLLWRGSITYAANRRYSVWARVLLKVSGPRLIAVEPLRSGQEIQAAQVRVEQWSGPLSRLDELTAPEDVAGQAVKFAIPAGAVLRRGMLTRPAEVQQGDIVRVRVTGLGASIAAEAIAQETGVRGAFISVKNETSGRKFRARVDGKDLVTVVRNDSPATGG
ncbi:MAG TPA: flagellar basal body P-ring formation chaperone FlgA [Bryobacteraceae bacterium]|nr:flagellar basal body P-ring formation chaperone FlgA [Bryobacteraceae bacterium]